MIGGGKRGGEEIYARFTRGERQSEGEDDEEGGSGRTNYTERSYWRRGRKRNNIPLDREERSRSSVLSD